MKPRPYLLSGERGALTYLAVARKTNRPVFFQGDFLPPLPELFTYAQIEIYNGIHNDTYTQDWRVRLAPASLLEVASRARGQSAFEDFAHFQQQFFDRNSSPFLGPLSNH